MVNSAFQLFNLRKLIESDRTEVVDLLSFLVELYPDADVWLQERLTAALRGTVVCTVAEVNGIIVGTMIETPKSEKRVKISTLFVRPAYRTHGIGTAFLTEAQGRWRKEGIQEAYITAPSSHAAGLEPLLNHFGFCRSAFAANRYGRNRHEIVFRWASADVYAKRGDSSLSGSPR